jgi:hypothetical protein
MGHDFVIEQDVFPFHAATEIVDNPSFPRALVEGWNHDANVRFGVSE